MLCIYKSSDACLRSIIASPGGRAAGKTGHAAQPKCPSPSPGLFGTAKRKSLTYRQQPVACEPVDANTFHSCTREGKMCASTAKRLERACRISEGLSFRPMRRWSCIDLQSAASKGLLMQAGRTCLGSEASSRTMMPLRMLALAVTRNTKRQPATRKVCSSPTLVAKKPPAVAPAKHEMSMPGTQPKVVLKLYAPFYTASEVQGRWLL